MHVAKSGRWVAVVGAALWAYAYSLAAPLNPTAPENDLAQRFVAGVHRGDTAAVTDLFDVREFGARIAVSSTDDVTQHPGITTAIINQAGDKLIGPLVQAMQQGGGQLKFRGAVERDKERRLLVRIDYPHGSGYEYIELVRVADASGKLRFVDWYQFTTGQLISDTIGAVTKLLSDPNPSLLKRMFGVEADAQTLEQIKRVGALNRQGRFAEALAALQQLPPQLREQRVLLRLQIVLASKSNDEAAYRKALAGFAASYGGDPADAFTLIDHYYYQQDYEKLLQAIAIVEKRVGTDGVVLLLRSNVELARRDFPRATTLAKSAIELEPGLWAAHLALLKAHAGLGNFDAGVRGIRAWEQSVGTPVPSEVLASQPDLAEFMKSREYAVWSAKRGTEGK